MMTLQMAGPSSLKLNDDMYTNSGNTMIPFNSFSQLSLDDIHQTMEWISGKANPASSGFVPFGHNTRGMICAFQVHHLLGNTNNQARSSPHQLHTPASTQPIVRHQPSPVRSSPISCFPPELLSEVFVHYVNQAEFIDEPPTGIHRGGSFTDPLPLSHVCSRWRGVATSLGSLWSSIHVHAPDARHVPLFQLWLKRSGSRSLDLTISSTYNHNQPIGPMREILSFAAQHSYRWKSISLSLFGNLQDAFTGIGMLGLIDRLESLNLDLEDWDSDNVTLLCAALHSSPSLQKAAWGRSCNEDIPYAVPWSQLKVIELDHLPTSRDLFDILSRCTQLESFNLDMMPLALTNSDCLHLTLPHLRKLRWGSIDHLSFILDRLTLPSLDELTIAHGFFGDPGVGFVAVENLLTRSGCRLSTLKISSQEGNEQSLVQLLRSPGLTSIRRLELATPITDVTINSFREADADVLLGKSSALLIMPCLECLALKNCRTSSVLPEYLEFRITTSPAPVKLSTISLLLLGDSYEQDLRDFQELLCLPLPLRLDFKLLAGGVEVEIQID